MEKRPESLYPERPIDAIEAKITELAKLDSGDTEPYDISETERGELLEREAKLSARLEAAYAITPQNAVIHLEYLLTPKGQAEFADLCGVTVPEFSNSLEAQKFLFDQQANLATIPAKQRQAFEGRTRNFVEGTLKQKLLDSMNAAGDIEIDEIENPHFITLRLTPELTQQKLEELRAFKSELKEMLQAADTESVLEEVWVEMVKLYLKRVNFMLAEISQSGAVLVQKEAVGLELSEAEKKLMSHVFNVDNPDQIASRYDKFKHGAAPTVTESGYRAQISESLSRFAETRAAASLDASKTRSADIRAFGLDEKKLKEKVFDPEYVGNAAAEVLTAYDLLSNEPPETFQPERSGPAADNKWQVIVSDAYSVMAVDSKQKIVKIPAKNQTPTSLFSITLAHEIEGHVLQHENKERIAMNLYQRVGSERSSVFAEGGAMLNQDYVSKAAFNYASPGHAHYVRAMIAKLEGGNYLDCVKAFYESARKPHQALLAEGDIDQKEYMKRCEAAVKLATNRARRLFRNGGEYDSSESHLTNSQPTAYLEQAALQERLQEHDMSHYLMLSGVNAEVLVFLRKAGFIDPADILLPKYQSLKMWESEKENFLSSSND